MSLASVLSRLVRRPADCCARPRGLKRGWVAVTDGVRVRRLTMHPGSFTAPQLLKHQKHRQCAHLARPGGTGKRVFAACVGCEQSSIVYWEHKFSDVFDKLG